MDVLAQTGGSLNLDFQYHAQAQQSYMSNSSSGSHAAVNTKSIDIEFSLQISYSSKEELAKQLDEIGEMIEDITEEAEEFMDMSEMFSADNTAQRIVQNILDLAGDDLGLVRSGREGMIQGFREMQQEHGKSLPPQSRETMKTAMEILDTLLSDFGANIIDQKA